MTPWRAAVAYCAVAALLFVVAGLSIRHLPMSPEPGQWSHFDNPWLDGWTRGDGGWYRVIAERGYWFDPAAQDPVPFFPAYPLAMRALAPVLGGALQAGMLVSFLAGLFVAVGFAAWCRTRLDEQQTRMALALWLLYPFSFFIYGCVYSEALFVGSALLAFLLVERDRPLAAGLAGALCTATRPFGLAIVPALWLRAWERRRAAERAAGRAPRLACWRDALPLVSAAGILSYWIFLWSSFGDPWIYPKATAAWGNQPGPHAWLKLDVIALWRQWPWGSPQLNNLFQAGLTLAAFAAIPGVVRRWGWSYGLFCLVVLGLPALSNHSFTDMGRYILPAFPCFAVLGAWLADRPRLAWPALAGSAAALLLIFSRFARWYYVA